MAQPLEWMIKLFDGMSGPAAKMTRSLDSLDATMHATQASTATLEKAQLAETVATKKQALEIPRLRKEIEALDREIAGLDGPGMFGGLESGITKLSSALHVAGAAWNVAKSIGHGALEVLKEIGANQATQGIFESMLGKDEGSEVLDWLGKIQMSTAFTRDQLEGMTQPLAEFFKGDQLKAVLVAGLDVGRGSMQRTSEALEVLTKVASTGKIKGTGFKALGLTASNEFKNLKGGDAGEASVTVNRILQMIAEKTGGTLGARSVQASGTVDAALAHLRGVPGELFEKLSNSAVLPKITDAISRLTAALTSPILLDGLVKIVDKIASSLPNMINALAKAINATDWDVVGSRVVWVVEQIANLLSFGSIGDEKFKRIQEQGGWRGALAHIPFARMALDTDSADDFVYRSNGSILKINSSDDVMGFKPGGPIAGGGMGGTVGDITINVSGAGDGQSIAQAIRDELRNVFSEHGIRSGVA